MAFALTVQIAGVFLTWQGRHLVPSGTAGRQLLIQLALATAGPLALLGARRFPGPVVAVVSAAAVADLFVGVSQNGPPYVALAFAIIGAVVRGARAWAWISVAAAWVVSLAVAVVTGATWPPFRIASTTLGILIVIGVAEAIRNRRERFEGIRRVVAQRRQSEVQAERVRIARELHDVLAHSLSQINVQAGVGLHLMDTQPAKAREALASIKDTSKTALDEVRSVLGILRADGAATDDAPLVPEPDLSRIRALAASVSSQNIEVTVTGSLVDGTTGSGRAPVPGAADERAASAGGSHDGVSGDGSPEVPRAIQLALYRIVQESLTNVARHARATRAAVHVEREPGFYVATITDNGGGLQRPPAGDTGGRGLLGMRERAELLGGTLEAGPLSGGGFRVAARIPNKIGSETEGPA